MKRLVLPIAVFSLLLAACGEGGQQGQGQNGAGKVSEGQLCEKVGDRGQGEDGRELLCQVMGDGKLVWRPEGGEQTMEGATLSQILGTGQCDSNSKEDKYTASIGEVSKMSHIYPMGGMITTHITPIDHIYIYYPENSNTPAAKGSYLVTSPADGKITSIEDFQKTNNYPYPDFRVVIEHSCNLYSVFIHIGELADGIATGSTVKAGQTIADDSQSPGFDFSTFDQNVKLSFANPASYMEAETWKPFTANPFAYFPADIKSQLEEKSLKATAPFDGKIDWDKDGSAQGNWFEKDSNGYRGKGDQTASYDNHGKVAHGYWDTHLAIAPDAVDNKAFIYSIGDWEGCPCQFMSVGNIDPTSITAASSAPTVISLVEYEIKNLDGSSHNPNKPKKGYTLSASESVVGLLALQVMPDGAMKVEKIPGKTDPKSFTGFSENARSYVR